MSLVVAAAEEGLKQRSSLAIGSRESMRVFNGELQAARHLRIPLATGCVGHRVFEMSLSLNATVSGALIDDGFTSAPQVFGQEPLCGSEKVKPVGGALRSVPFVGIDHVLH